MTKGVLSVLDS